MSIINFIYPFGDLNAPKTGGQVYDSRFYNEINKITAVKLWNEKDLGISKVKGLFFGLLKLIPKIGKKDIIIFNSSWFAYFIPLLLLMRLVKPNVKSYAIHHHFRYFEFKGFGRFIRKALEIYCLKKCTGVISPNPYTTNLLRKFKSQNKIYGIRITFEREEIRTQPQLRNLLYVGTIYRRKGIHTLIEAAKILKDKGITNFYINLVGSMDNTAYCTLLSERINEYKLNDNIKFWGRVPKEELRKIYSETGWFVLPSYHEGYGMVIAEAMSYGIPVIAFNNSAIPYLVKDNYNGILVETGNFLELAEAIERAIKSDEFRNNLSRGAKETFDKLPDYNDFKKEVNNFITAISK